MIYRKIEKSLFFSNAKISGYSAKISPQSLNDYVVYNGNEDVVYHNIRYCNWLNLDKI